MAVAFRKGVNSNEMLPIFVFKYDSCNLSLTNALKRTASCNAYLKWSIGKFPLLP